MAVRPKPIIWTRIWITTVLQHPPWPAPPPAATVGQYVTQTGDTDDNDPNINPGCELVFYLDEDNDGFGDGEPLTFCENPDPTKYSDLATPVDCDDTDPNINPDAFTTYYLDSDGDGYGDPESKDTFSQSSCLDAPEGFVTNHDDCNDNNELAYPGAPNITYYLDMDDDGYGFDDEFDVRSACDPAPGFN